MVASDPKKGNEKNAAWVRRFPVGWAPLDRRLGERFGQRLGSAGLKVYVALSLRANADGESFPSHGTIARQFGMSKQSVISAIKLLESLGLISVKHRKHGSLNQSNLYQLLPLPQDSQAGG